jgi:RecB family exonuclease
MQQVGVPELPDRSALEQVGWLELPLDDAPVVVVAGVTEGQIPESADTDPYLPNALRMRLGLRDDAYRLARDLYVLHQLQSTKEVQHYIAARISPQQDPLVLSRILLMGERSTARGILANFYGVEGLQAPRSNGSAPPMPQQMALTLPATSRSAYSRVPEPTTFGGYAPPASIAVTDFRKYLRCPYTYFLERVLRASPVEPVPQELEPRQWGSALHEVLQRFGSGDYRESQDPLEIENVLLQEFDRLFDRKFGPGVVPAVFVQRAQVAARLRSFAKWQADWAAAGWKIVATERQFRPREVQLALSSGGSIGIHGTIDRIDRNQESGEFCVFDYKTGDTVQKPETAHLSRSRGWIDLQLPAYEYLVRTAGVVEAGTTVLLGYIPISGESIVKELLAKWSPEVLSSAHAAMQEIASKIEAGVFWPPKEGISPNHPIDALIFGGHFAS